VIKEIEFKQTSNIFLNSGIIGLYIYLNKHKKDSNIDYTFDYKLEKDHLKITSDNLFNLLEDVYYKMGKDYYDTSAKKAIDENANAYYSEKENKFYRFPKMYSYGLSGLLTNNAAGKTRIKENTKRIKQLLKNNENEAIIKIFEDYFEKEKLILLQEIYFNEPYTKITRMDFDEKYFNNGDKSCSLTGEKFEKLIEYTCSSPLLAGINNFESFGYSKSRQISWKASYLSKFSPVLSLYMYIDGLDKIVCYFFQSDNLSHTYQLYKNYKLLFLDKLELIENNYMCNFKIIRFDNQNKGDQVIDKNTEFVWQSEILFMLLYTYYRNFFFKKPIEKDEDSDGYEPVNRYDEVPISLIYFRSDSFASTMRPYLFEQFNHYKFIIRFFTYLEKEKKINSQKMWSLLVSLRYIKESEKKSINKYKIERKLRNEILEEVLNIKSIIKNIKLLFYNCFNDLINNEYTGFRDFNLVFIFLSDYEKIIKFGGNESMNEDLQAKAVELGTYIGMGIIHYDSPQKKTDKENNVKGGRKYIISLNKTRTLQQFLDEIVRIKIKYGNFVNEDLLKSIKDDNWEYIKSFCIISALNKLNLELLPKKEDKGESK
jgi:hypothetical protein